MDQNQQFRPPLPFQQQQQQQQSYIPPSPQPQPSYAQPQQHFSVSDYQDYSHPQQAQQMQYEPPFEYQGHQQQGQGQYQQPQFDQVSMRSYGSQQNLVSDMHSPPPAMPYPPQQQMSYHDPSANMGYGYNPYGNAMQVPAPPRSDSGFTVSRDAMMRRRTVKRVELQDGKNLVIDMPVPSQIAREGGALEKDEGKFLTYTAATCDPNDYMKEKFSLRQFTKRRETELFIVMTQYNETPDLFCKTFNAVVKNINHLCSKTNSKVWGPTSWKKVVVCIVSDGRSKIDSNTLKILTLLGVYQDGVCKTDVGGKDVQAHIFEYTTQFMAQPNGDVKPSGTPIQLLFCLKEKNAKKLNSHRWFFNAFGPLLQPNVCVLLDVGTKPSGTSIYHLYKAFSKNPGLGGCCGEICVDTGNYGKNLWNPLVAAQNFEYKMSNILDKPTESVFGYISVLPGAFSAYRYKALQNGSNGRGPLHSYFKGESMHGPNASGSIFDANMYLAEDRILCFEIVTKKQEAWTLKYVKAAKASTDVPTSVAEFISQRRRWLNGSFFASLHASIFFFKIFTSGQGFMRMFLLFFEFIYIFINLIFTFISIGNFFLAFFFLTTAATSTPEHDPFNGYGPQTVGILQKVYLGLIAMVILSSLGNRPQGSRVMYTFVIVAFALLQGLALFCAAWTIYVSIETVQSNGTEVTAELLFGNETFRNIGISLLSTFGLYILGSVIHMEPWHLLTSTVQYLFLLPSFINVLMIYSMCNLHDVSWGTKGDNGGAKDEAKVVKGSAGKQEVEVKIAAKEDTDKMFQSAMSSLAYPEVEKKGPKVVNMEDNYKTFRTNVILIFFGFNIFLIVFFTSDFFLTWSAKAFNLGSNGGTLGNPYLIFIFYSVAALAAIRFIGSTLYLLLRCVGC